MHQPKLSLISENTDLMVVKILDWEDSKYTPIVRREHSVEVRVLFQGKSFLFVPGTATSSENFHDLISGLISEWNVWSLLLPSFRLQSPWDDTSFHNIQRFDSSFDCPFDFLVHFLPIRCLLLCLSSGTQRIVNDS